MNRDEAEDALPPLVASIGAALPDVYLGDVPELIEMHEWNVALEDLCCHLGDQHDGVCPSELYPTLIAVAQGLGVDPRYWRGLRAG